MTVPDPVVYESASGLAVVTEDPEGVRVALRGQRRARNRTRRQKRSQRLTGGSAGTSTWLPRAKRITRLAHRIEETHTPGVNGRKGAKIALKVEKELVGKIEKHIKGD